jgi:hypothetical protein
MTNDENEKFCRRINYKNGHFTDWDAERMAEE